MIWMMLPALILAGMAVPLWITTDIHHGARKLMRVQITLIGLHREWLAETVGAPGERRLIIRRNGREARSVSSSDISGSPADTLRTMLRENRRVRRYLSAHTHAEQICVQLLLHAPSAASTALLTGTAQTLLHLLPSRWRRISRIRVTPDFLHDQSTLQARCIFRLRVGTLLITAGLLLADHVARAINREAQSIWNTPSEN